VTPSGALYRYRELYGWGGQPNVGSRETADEVARKIVEIEREAGEYNLIGVADNRSGLRDVTQARALPRRSKTTELCGFLPIRTG